VSFGLLTPRKSDLLEFQPFVPVIFIF